MTIRRSRTAAARSPTGEQHAAQEAIRAAVDGEIDAFVLTDSRGRKRFFTLAGADAEYRAFVENMSEGAIITASDGTVTFANRRFATMVGAPLTEVIASSIFRWVSPDDIGPLHSAFMATGGTQSQRLPVVLKGRTAAVVPAQISIECIRSGIGRAAAGEASYSLVVTDLSERTRDRAAIAAREAELETTTVALLNILEDYDKTLALEEVNRELRHEVEERRRSEAALRRAKTELEATNAELEAFSYSVSHDLRGPLRAVDGFALLLSTEHGAQLDPQGLHHLERIRSGVHRMSQLIDDLLELSRITRAEMSEDSVDLSEMARAVLAELRDGEPARTVDAVIADGVIARGDARLLRVALGNLLANAWKFTRPHARARIEFGATRDPGALMYFVRDDGVGFDMAFADRLFAPFQRLHAEREFEGTGVGLAIVKRVVARHGGRVWAEGAVDRGACFSFTLFEHTVSPDAW
ncbi:MAG TPA: ATP-binding protein [Candidatus Limnocylindria bacterium]|nr:ATP-binding protein [Candidatus Limnocylindria bacterium]